LGRFSKNYRTFNPKNWHKALKKWGGDPGSGKNLFQIQDPLVKKAPNSGSGSTTLLSIYTLWATLRQKTISRCCPFKPTLFHKNERTARN